jgi:hypothetical protein
MQRLTVGVIAALIPVVLLTGCERAKIKLDREVDRMCAIDGGVHIYEKVTLPREDFGPDGEVFPQFAGRPTNRGRFGSEYEARIADELLAQGDPALLRLRTQIVRLSDQKVLGELVIYRRSGGDFPGPWEPSRYSCPIGPVFNLETQIFNRQGE